jgi:putative ABC transport system ATP-binding protein/macrolide transport system ATP-binding/permease protein/lipoprotein-releasing system ATP-binding protein
MLEARNLRKSYPASAESGRVDAVRDISLKLEAGQFLAVVGRSGSGKSTLLAMLGGLCRPTSGTVLLNGVDLWTRTEAERAAFRSRQVGLVFQFPSLLPTLRVVDNVALPALIGGTLEDHAAYCRATELLARVGLSDRANAYPSELSGGEQRRAALARAIVNAPPILLADEPTSDLDEDHEAEILDVLQEIRRREGVALVLVTHDREIARRADRIEVIRNGELVASLASLSPALRPPGRLLPLGASQDSDADSDAGIPAGAPPVPAPEPRAPSRLGAEFSPWLLAVGAWVVPAVFLALSLNQGVALYQRHLLHQRQHAREALEDAALLWLRANLDDITYAAGSSYSLTLSLENLSAGKAVFAMTPAVRAYVQVGLTWQEIPTKSVDGQESRVARVMGRRIYQFEFEPNVTEYTEQLAGYMHVRLTSTTLVSQHSEPDNDLVERVDDYYVHLKPHGADEEAILSKTRFPGRPPLWIPMPPH